MKFQFRMQTVLRQRERERDQARFDYLEARRMLDECLAELDNFYKEVDESRAEIHNHQSHSDQNSVSHIVYLESYISGVNLKIKNKKLQARELMRLVEDKLEDLTKANQNVKSLEKYKEKKFAEWKELEKKLELKKNEDLMIMKYGRGENEN